MYCQCHRRLGFAFAARNIRYCLLRSVDVNLRIFVGRFLENFKREVSLADNTAATLISYNNETLDQMMNDEAHHNKGNMNILHNGGGLAAPLSPNEQFA